MRQSLAGSLGSGNSEKEHIGEPWTLLLGGQLVPLRDERNPGHRVLPSEFSFFSEVFALLPFFYHVCIRPRPKELVLLSVVTIGGNLLK